MSNKLCLAASLLVLAAGCGTAIHSTVMNPAPHPMLARPPASVEMFSSGPPARAHIDVALLEAEEQSSLSTAHTPELLGKLRERGAAMGCDGVVIGGESLRDPGITDAETWVNKAPRGRKGFTATCIMYIAP